jgi:hypothetical protein
VNAMSIFISRSSTTKCGEALLGAPLCDKKFEIAIEHFELNPGKSDIVRFLSERGE